MLLVDGRYKIKTVQTVSCVRFDYIEGIVLSGYLL